MERQWTQGRGWTPPKVGLVLVTVGAGRRKTKIADAKRKPRKQAKRSKPKRKTGAPVGRPRKFMDLEEAVRLAALGMPQSAIASTLGVSARKLAREKAENPDFAEAFDSAVREGTGTWEIEVSKGMLSAIKNGHTGPLLAAWEHLHRKYGEKPGENPLLLEIPLANNCTLLVPEGIDPVLAIKHRDAIQEIPRSKP